MLSSIPVLVIVALIPLNAGQEWTTCSKNGGSCPNTLITGDEGLSDAVCNFLYAPGRLPELGQVTGDDKYALTELNKLCTKSASLCCNIPEYNCSDSAATIGQNVCELEKLHGFCTSDQNNAAQGCSATCGLCLYKGPPGCEDKDRRDCESLCDFCSNPQFSAFLQETCPWTCGKCPGRRNLTQMVMNL
uniref:ShKT domain-containing protein n=1 Tax=Parascaris univalens TaxID=6257 RepID=A0A915AUV3_PARUN